MSIGFLRDIGSVCGWLFAEEPLDGNEEVDVAVLGEFGVDVSVVDERRPDGDIPRNPESGDLATHLVLE